MAPERTGGVAKGVNPAPNFNLLMNKMQLQWDARRSSLKDPSLPSNRPALVPTAKTSSFSSLKTAPQQEQHQSSSETNPDQTPKSNRKSRREREQQQQQRTRATEEAEFAEEKALPPNAGIGFGVVPSSAASGLSTSDEKLRRTILGKRRPDPAGNNNNKTNTRTARGNASSDDDEPGRGGLVRAKRGGDGKGAGSNRKRKIAQREEEAVDAEVAEGESGENNEATLDQNTAAAGDVNGQEGDGGDLRGLNQTIMESEAVNAGVDDTSLPVSPIKEAKKEKRKKKNKKRKKEGQAD